MLNILNYYGHPTRVGFIVFQFYEKERADYFQTLLKKENIYFEFSYEEEIELYLYGIKKGDSNNAARANYLVNAKFRNKIIPNIYFRWGIILFVGAILLLALIGALLKT